MKGQTSCKDFMFRKHIAKVWQGAWHFTLDGIVNNAFSMVRLALVIGF